MEKILIQTSSKRRFDLVRNFVEKNGYTTNEAYTKPEKVPFGAFPKLKNFLYGDSQTAPDLCIVDLQFRNDDNGAVAFDCFDHVLFSSGVSFTPVIFLIQDDSDKGKIGDDLWHNKENKFSETKTRTIYWPNDESFNEVEKQLIQFIEEMLKIKELFPNKKIINS
jgi:hypothetical protein